MFDKIARKYLVCLFDKISRKYLVCLLCCCAEFISNLMNFIAKKVDLLGFNGEVIGT